MANISNKQTKIYANLWYGCVIALAMLLPFLGFIKTGLGLLVFAGSVYLCILIYVTVDRGFIPIWMFTKGYIRIHKNTHPYFFWGWVVFFSLFCSAVLMRLIQVIISV